jgi:hypothetical protein
MNAELCHIQNEIIHKYALGNRIEVGILWGRLYCESASCELRVCELRVANLRVCELRVCELRVCEFTVGIYCLENVHLSVILCALTIDLIFYTLTDLFILRNALVSLFRIFQILAGK